MKFLIADDSMFMRARLKEICKGFAADASFEEAGTGLDAIKKCETFQPDMIFMDITMPQMDGVEATKVIKQRWPKSRLIICSAIADTQKAIEGLTCGADELIAKPFSKEQILNLLNKWLKA